MNVGSGFSDAAREVDLTVANTGGLAARGVSTGLAGAVAADLAVVEDLADRAAKVLSAALVAVASGCSRPAISSW